MEMADTFSSSTKHREGVQTVNRWRRHCEDFHINCRRDQRSAHNVSLPTRLFNIQKLHDASVCIPPLLYVRTACKHPVSFVKPCLGHPKISYPRESQPR